MAIKLKTPTPEQSQFFIFNFNSTFGLNPYITISPGFIKGLQQYYKLHNLCVNALCSAVVANRYGYISIAKYASKETQQGINIDFKSGTITATQSARLSINTIGTLSGATLYGKDVICNVQMDPLVVCGDDQIIFGISNGDAGDYYELSAEFEYLNNSQGITQS